MIDRLIADIIETVETLINADAIDMNALAGANVTLHPKTHESKHASKGMKAGTKEYKEHHRQHKNIYARPC